MRMCIYFLFCKRFFYLISAIANACKYAPHVCAVAYISYLHVPEENNFEFL